MSRQREEVPISIGTPVSLATNSRTNFCANWERQVSTARSCWPMRWLARPTHLLASWIVARLRYYLQLSPNTNEGAMSHPFESQRTCVALN